LTKSSTRLPLFFVYDASGEQHIRKIMTNNNKGSEPKHQTPTKLKPVLTKHGVLYRPFAPIGIAPVLSQVAIGVACASYWRGCWQVLYLLSYYTYCTCILLHNGVLMYFSSLLVVWSEDADEETQQTTSRMNNRCCIRITMLT
jgi:hypothetical protein